jgi:hypothetical protein
MKCDFCCNVKNTIANEEGVVASTSIHLAEGLICTLLGMQKYFLY